MAALFCGLVALPALVLWSFRAAGFVSDDIFFGPGFHLDSWREIWLGPWPHPMGLSKAWRPVVVLTYLAESAWPDAGPTGYHLFNHLLHGLNAALLSVLVWQLAHERVAAAVAGVLFAVHPIVHENVQWISGRTYPVAALFILALCVWTAGAPRRRGWLQHGAGVPLFVAALASYEFAIAAPVAVLGVAWLAWGRNRFPSTWRALALFALPYLTTLVVYFCFRWLWLTSLNADVVVTALASSWAPIGPIAYRAPRNLMFAVLRLLAWPWFERGSDVRIGLTGVLTTVTVAWSMATVIRSTRLRAAGMWWILWTAAFYAPVSVALAFSDRFGYLSAAGVAALIGTAAISFKERSGTMRRAAFAVLLSAMAIGWAVSLRGHGREWDEAGRIAASLLSQLREREPPPEQPLALHVIDVPVRHGSALLFLTYFPLAVQRAYPEPARKNLSIYLETGPDDEVVRRVRAAPSDGAARVYRWEPVAGRLVLVWRRG
jgi:hypothetical protein